MSDQVHYYFLIAGEVIFRTKEDETINAVRLNTVVLSEALRVPVALIGKAQQGLQLQFFKNMGDSSLTVVDVVILAITNLGQFTSEEFHAPPEGTTKAEMDSASHA